MRELWGIARGFRVKGKERSRHCSVCCFLLSALRPACQPLLLLLSTHPSSPPSLPPSSSTGSGLVLSKGPRIALPKKRSAAALPATADGAASSSSPGYETPKQVDMGQELELERGKEYRSEEAEAEPRRTGEVSEQAGGLPA